MQTKVRLPWIFLMAWRDCRRNFLRLVFTTLSIAIGISGLVAVLSFKDSLTTALNLQSRVLLGADLLVSSQIPLSSEAEEFLAQLGENRSQEVSLSTMVRIPTVQIASNNKTRLVQLSAISGEFPYYGEFETIPLEAANSFKESQNRALVDRLLVEQYKLQLGDSIIIGKSSFTVHGILKRVPGSIDIRSAIAPRIYIALNSLEDTKLIQKGSRASYNSYYKFTEEMDLDVFKDSLENQLNSLKLRAETVLNRQRRVGRALDTVFLFLNISGFIALAIGAIGIASTSHIYLIEKTRSIAILRCLGSKTLETCLIFSLQIFFVGIIGTVLGLIFGNIIQLYLPRLVKDLISIDIMFSISWSAVSLGLLVGIVTILLFTCASLSALRLVSPIECFRINRGAESLKDPFRFILWPAVLVVSYCLIFTISSNFKLSMIFFAGLLITVFILSLSATTLILCSRKWAPAKLPFALRHGLKNLFRPNNQTKTLTITLGMSIFLMALLTICQTTVLSHVNLIGSEKQPNLLLVDVQPDQLTAVEKFLVTQKMPVLDQVPIVTMRLEKINTLEVSNLLKDPNNTIPNWVISREYRSTYRDTLSDSEEITQGEFLKTPFKGSLNGNSLLSDIPVSLEEEIANKLNVSLGDSLTFDIQGVSVKTTVASIRKVDWQRVQPNFFVVFPPGILEEAPKFFVVVTRSDSARKSASFQTAAVENFPNISIVDLSLILETVDSILDRISSVVQFIGGFSVIAAFLVLIGVVFSSRWQRERENILLRTLGAKQSTIYWIIASEYLLLGLISGLIGILTAAAAGYIFAKFVLEASIAVNTTQITIIFIVSTLSTLIIGMLASSGTYNKPVMEALRSDPL